MGSQHLATYFFPGRGNVDVYGMWDSQTAEGAFEHYDLFDCESGDCLNEGHAFYDFPTWAEVLRFLSLVAEMEAVAC